MSRNTCQHTIKIKHGGLLRHADGHTHAQSAVCFLCSSWGLQDMVGGALGQTTLKVSVLGPPGKSSLGLILKSHWEHGQRKPSHQQELSGITHE